MIETYEYSRESKEKNVPVDTTKPYNRLVAWNIDEDKVRSALFGSK